MSDFVGVKYKYYGSFEVSPEVFDIPEPEDYPALYGGVISDGTREIIADYIVLRSKDDFEKLVERLKKTHEEISGITKIEKKLEGLEVDMKIQAVAKEYTTVVDDEDYEILKAGWQLGVKRYGKDLRRAGIVGYDEWLGYSGLDRATSDEINAYLWDMAFLKKKFDLKDLVAELSEEFGLDEKQAELIVRTEMANIFNKMREWGYLEKTDVKKFVWVAKEDSCELCKRVEKMSKKGVTLEELKAFISEVGFPYSREWTVHPNCRCSFVRKSGKKQGWEKI